jgi:uncharacterized membrane protein
LSDGSRGRIVEKNPWSFAMSETVSSGPSSSSSSEDHLLAALGYLLLLAAPCCFGVSALVAVALAYGRKPAAQPLTLGHYGFQTRIFWIGLVLALLMVLAAAFGAAVLYGDVMAAVREHVSLADYFAAASQLDDIKFHPTGVIALIVSGLLGLATTIWLIVTSVFGLVRLASNQPIGR